MCLFVCLFGVFVCCSFGVFLTWRTKSGFCYLTEQNATPAVMQQALSPTGQRCWETSAEKRMHTKCTVSAWEAPLYSTSTWHFVMPGSCQLLLICALSAWAAIVTVHSCCLLSVQAISAFSMARNLPLQLLRLQLLSTNASLKAMPALPIHLPVCPSSTLLIYQLFFQFIFQSV